MRIGFTGTRYGMSKEQQECLLQILQQHTPISEFHHGCCTGSDAQAHELVRKYFPQTKIVVHPPKNKENEAPCVGDVMLPPLDYLGRNRKIVKAVDLVIATPLEEEEQPRGGTWFTVKYAQKNQIPHTIISPSGKVKINK